MAHQAQVTAIDALENFRVNLILFATAARRNLAEVADRVNRTRFWVQEERRLFWEAELRRRERRLDLARQELMSARLSALRDRTSAQQNAVRQAMVAVAEAGEKLRRVKVWSRDFDHRVGPFLKRLEGLASYLDLDLPRAVATLARHQETLAAYAGRLTAAPFAVARTGPAGGPGEPGADGAAGGAAAPEKPPAAGPLP